MIQYYVELLTRHHLPFFVPIFSDFNSIVWCKCDLHLFDISGRVQ